MKIKVTRRFIDRANEMKTRESGEIYEAPEERAGFLIRLGLAESIEEPKTEPAAEQSEAAEAPEKAPEPADGEKSEPTPKTAKRTKKTAK